MSGTAPQHELQHDRRLTPADVDVLVSYLADEEQTQRELLDRLVQKEGHLMRQDLPGLETCLREIEPIVVRLEACTRRRVRILRSMGGRLGLRPEELQVSTLVGHCGESDRQRLEDARLRLRDVLVRIGNQNRRNHVLIRNGIELNDAMVRALFGAGEAGRTYDRSARSQVLPASRSFVNQEL